MTEKQNINFQWNFKEKCTNNFEDELNNQEGFIEVDLPHSNTTLPYNYFDQRDLFKISCYKKTIRILPSMLKKDIFLVCEGIANVSYFYIDNNFVGKHEGGYDEFKLELTSFLTELKDYTLTIFVDSNENKDVPPFGNTVDYLGYGGIYRNVYLELTDKIKIIDVYPNVSNPKQGETSKVMFDIEVNGGTEINIKIEDVDCDYEIVNEKDVYTFTIENTILWDIDNPKLYTAEVRLYDGYTVIDEKTYTFGIRSAKFTSEGFFLNNRSLKLYGLNRHQSYPYIGNAMIDRFQKEDAHILKEKLGVNIVRTSHYMQSRAFLDECDKIGLLVLEEIPGWQYIGGTKFKENTYQNITSMILRDKLHPSIILWGVRINESKDDHEFYTNTNKLAHRLDPYRATCGIRNFKNSEFLEDVYTYNDFSQSEKGLFLADKKEITKEKNPYLVTEANGHMFPTKSFDNESRRLQHALYHLKVYDKAFGANKTSGALTWCMADYNTHKDFGSGDMICYHGVLDMFRNPKLAGLAISSLKDVNKEEDIVMEVSSSLNIGEYNGSVLFPIYVFTNLDYVILKQIEDNKERIIGKYYPNNDEFKNLKHPPIRIDDFIYDRLEKDYGFTKKDSENAKRIQKEVSLNGDAIPLKSKLQMAWILKKYHLTIDRAIEMFYEYNMLWSKESSKLVFEGYLNDKLVKQIVKEEVKEVFYDVNYSSDELVVGSTYDMVKATIRAIDQNGNLLSYNNKCFEIETTGALEVVGPKLICLIGGQISFWCKTNTNYRKEKFKNQNEAVDNVVGNIIIKYDTNEVKKEIKIKLEK